MPYMENVTQKMNKLWSFDDLYGFTFGMFIV